MKAAAGLANLAHNFTIREQIGVLGGTQYILGTFLLKILYLLGI